MHENQFTVDINDNVVPYDDMLMTIQATQGQMNTILAGCNTTASFIKKEFTNQAKRKQDEFFLLKMAAHIPPVTPSPAPTCVNNDHDAFLYHRWHNTNKKQMNTGTNKPTTTPHINLLTSHTTAYAPIKIPVKDDPSVTPTLETLCTHNTCSLHPTNIDTNVILNITLWNQPIAQYQMPIQPFVYTHNRF